MSAPKLIVFVKAPRPGTVKTRLGLAIGAEAACAVYRKLVEVLLETISPLAAVELRISPDDAEAEISEWLRPGWSAVAQGTGDLGDKLDRAFLSAFEQGFDRVVIIGSDCPEIGLEDIAAAWGELERSEVVLGPAWDGGYWLVGLRSHRPQLFRGIAWSTNAVLGQTLEHCRHAGLSVGMLRGLADVDTEEDWRRFTSSSR